MCVCEWLCMYVCVHVYMCTCIHFLAYAEVKRKSMSDESTGVVQVQEALLLQVCVCVCMYV